MFVKIQKFGLDFLLLLNNILVNSENIDSSKKLL